MNPSKEQRCQFAERLPWRRNYLLTLLRSQACEPVDLLW
jgi:hypothetical protein